MATESVVNDSLATRRARIDLAAAHRWAVRDGLNEGTWNHFSCLHPEDPTRILLTPPDTHWSQVMASSIVEVGADYDQANGSEMAWIGYRIHYPIHQARPDAVCALHVHSPCVVALSTLEDCELLMTTQASLAFYGRVAYTAELDAFADDDLDQGHVMAEALGGHCTVLILRHHGAVVVGPTVADAYTETYLLERCCQTQLLADATGKPVRRIPRDQIEACSWAGAIDSEPNRLHFEALKRVLDREEPGYAE